MYNMAELDRAASRTGLRQSRQDNWYSTLGGLGGGSDRGRPNTIRFRDCLFLDDATLSAAYRDVWLVRRIVEARASEALRREYLPEGTETPIFDELNWATHSEGAFQRACHMADLKGGAGLFIGYKETTGPDALLEPAREGAEVAFLEVFDRFQLTGQQRVADLDVAEFDRPQIWQVTSGRRSGLRFHESRMIRFPGAPRGDHNLTRSVDRDWDDSILQAIWPDVQRYGVLWQTVTALLQQNSIGVLKIAGLIQLLASKQQDAAEARIDLLNQTLSNNRLMMLDAAKQEEYHREVGSMADVPQLLDRLEVATSAAVGRPVAVLFGRAPAGLNATGESDMRMWYDSVECYRTRVIEPRLEKVLSICERTPIEVEFQPLWSPTEKEQAEVRALEIKGTLDLWTMKVLDEAEIRAGMIDGDWPELTVTGPPPEPEPLPVPAPGQVQPPGTPAPAPLPRADAVFDRNALASLLESFADR